MSGTGHFKDRARRENETFGGSLSPRRERAHFPSSSRSCCCKIKREPTLPCLLRFFPKKKRSSLFRFFSCTINQLRKAERAAAERHAFLLSAFVDLHTSTIILVMSPTLYYLLTLNDLLSTMFRKLGKKSKIAEKFKRYRRKHI